MRKGQYLDRYNCEFEFIPNVLTSLYIDCKIDDFVMTHPIEWKKILRKKGYNYDFGVKNIVVEKDEKYSKKKKSKFIITFPTPKVTPECFYAILFINKNDYKYFTLELEFGSSDLYKEEGGVICGQSGQNHLNYGRRCKNDLKEFDKNVQDIFDGKPYDSSNDFKNFDFKSAAKLAGINEGNLEEECIIY